MRNKDSLIAKITITNSIYVYISGVKSRDRNFDRRHPWCCPGINSALNLLGCVSTEVMDMGPFSAASE